MNIAKILKDCPKGTKLYSSIFGEIKLCEIELNEDYPIKVYVSAFNTTNIESFTKDGKIFNRFNDAECVLFPSKDNKDWSTFKLTKKHEFKPFDKVLVKDDDFGSWRIDLFSHIDNSVKEYKYICMSDSWNQCILYEGNEHLLGTSNNPR